MKLALSPQSFSRPAYGLPELPLVNMIGEEGPFGVTFLPRPPLTSRATVGTGPVGGVLRSAGVFAGSTFTVSGEQLYRGTSLLGSIPGQGMVRFAATEFQVVIVRPSTGKAYVYQQTGLKEIADPDLPPVSDVFYLNGRFYFIAKDLDTIWFTEIGDAEDTEGLSFFNIERKPDDVVAATTLGSYAWFFGEETTELWSPSDDANQPLAHSQSYDKGCIAQFSVCQIDNQLAWVGNDLMVYLSGGSVPQRISTASVEEDLRLCQEAGDVEDCTAFVVSHDGHTLYVLNIPGRRTWVWGAQGKGWSNWSSLGRDTFRARCGLMSGGEAFLGDDTDGTVWKFNAGGQYLDGSDHIVREWSAYIASDQRARIPPINLQAVMGMGAHTDPAVEMRVSPNGLAFGDWDSRSLGQQGEVNRKAVWRRKGMVDSRGAVLHFRTSENILSVAIDLTLEARP